MKRLNVSEGLAAAMLVASMAAIMFGFGTLPSTGDIVLKNAGTAYVLIVGGICRDPDELVTQQESLEAVRGLVVENLSVPPNGPTFLAPSSPAGASSPDSPTAEHVKAAIATIAAKAQPKDIFIFWYKGQANVVQDTLRINLDGPDMTHEELAKALSSVKSHTAIIVLDCPGAGLAVKSLTGQGRIIMCGARGDQPYATSFTQYFVPAITDPKSDFDSNGAVSVLEAYRRAVTTIDDLYLDKGQLKTEIPLLEDDGDGVPTQEPWQADEETYDGPLAARVYIAGPPKSEGKQ